jgi:hypothetical protein
MIALVILSTLACTDLAIKVHLAVAEPSWFPSAFPPGFTECDDCASRRFDLPGSSGVVRFATAPLLTIAAEQAPKSWIKAETLPLQPKRRVYSLLVAPGAELQTQVDSILAELPGERVAFLSCGSVTQVGFVAGRWQRNIPVAAFTSEDGARTFAKRLGFSPTVIPYDPAADEENRILFLRVVLDQFADEESPERAILKNAPELHRFLEQHPRYWTLLSTSTRPTGPSD